jgi:hypothetical protein
MSDELWELPSNLVWANFAGHAVWWGPKQMLRLSRADARQLLNWAASSGNAPVPGPLARSLADGNLVRENDVVLGLLPAMADTTPTYNGLNDFEAVRATRRATRRDARRNATQRTRMRTGGAADAGALRRRAPRRLAAHPSPACSRPRAAPPPSARPRAPAPSAPRGAQEGRAVASEQAPHRRVEAALQRRRHDRRRARARPARAARRRLARAQ